MRSWRLTKNQYQKTFSQPTDGKHALAFNNIRSYKH